MSLFLEVDQNFPQPGIVEHLVEIIKANHGVFIYPTDTIYGLGCSISDKEAVEKIRLIKGRDDTKPFPLLFDNLKRLEKYVDLSPEQKGALKQYLPGPFTFILKASNKVPKYLVADDGTVGVRIPQNRLCQAIVKELSQPIITTSVNSSGEPVATDPSKIPEAILKNIDVVLDAGVLNSQPSTIVDLTVKPYRIIRQGVGRFQ